MAMAGNGSTGARKPPAYGEERALSSDHARLIGKTFQSGSPRACCEGAVSLVMVLCCFPCVAQWFGHHGFTGPLSCSEPALTGTGMALGQHCLSPAGLPTAALGAPLCPPFPLQRHQQRVGACYGQTSASPACVCFAGFSPLSSLLTRHTISGMAQ